MTDLVINNLTVVTNDKRHTLLDNVSCCLSENETLAIIGPNGAGKSSLLHTISGDLINYHGDIELANISLDLKTRAKQIAVLPQFSLLNFPYRVYEVVLLGRTPHRTGLKIDNQITAEVLDIMDISNLSQRLYTELSGGEKQRVQLARVLAQIWRIEDTNNGKRILLLDEPTTALDLGHQYQLMQTLKQFSATGVMIIMVLHDLNLAARYADRTLALLDSKALAFGKTRDVLTQSIIEKLFSTTVTVTTHPDDSTPVILSQ